MSQSQFIQMEIDGIKFNIKPDGGTLISKISDLMQECSYIQKRGYNSFNNYYYATEADVAEKVSPGLSKRKLVMIPNVMEKDVVDHMTRNNKREYIATIKMSFVLLDGESGESLSFTMAGQGQDPGDKSIFKAISGTQKYAILKLLQIETGLDPENEAGLDHENKNKNGSQSSQNGPGQNRGSNTPANGKNSNTGKTEQTQKPSGGSPQGSSAGQAQNPLLKKYQDMRPYFKNAKQLADDLGWDLDMMMQAINHWRKNQQLEPVGKWTQLDNEWQQISFEKMIRQLEIALQNGGSRSGN
jgi:hypothetical protein